MINLINILFEDITKDKAKLQALFQKVLSDPDINSDDLNKIKNALTNKKYQDISQDRKKTTKDVLDKYAGKFKLSKTLEKYIGASNVKPEYKFQFEKLMQDPENILTKEKLEAKDEGNLLDLVSSRLKKNPLFNEVSDQLLTFRARGKGVGEAWLLAFGKNPSLTGEGDVSIDGMNLELKDGEAEFSIDTKLGKNNKYIQDKLNDEFYKNMGRSEAEFPKTTSIRKAEAGNLSKIRSQIKNIQTYLDSIEKGEKVKRPNKRSIPSEEDLIKYSNINPELVKDLRENIKTVKKSIREATKSPGVNFNEPSFIKFLLSQKKENPELLKKSLSSYYNQLYDGASINVNGLVDYIFNNIGNSKNITNAITIFVFKQYFAIEKFDALMVIHPTTKDYYIFTKDFVSNLQYGDELPKSLIYSPKFKRGSDSQNLADGWVNVRFA